MTLITYTESLWPQKVTFMGVAPAGGKILPVTEREEELQSRRHSKSKDVGVVDRRRQGETRSAFV